MSRLNKAAALIICLIFITLNASVVYAQDINDKDAKKLQTIFETILQKQKEAVEKGGSTLTTNGSIAVEQADDYYAVTLPTMAVTDEKLNKTEIGMIAVNVKPTDDNESWKMSVALPMPVIKKNKDGTVLNELNIGQQKMSGLWHEKIQNFSKVDAQYTNVIFKDLTKNTSLTVDTVVIDSDVKLNDDKVSGPTKISLNNISSKGKNGADLITVKNVTFNADYDDIDVAMINSTNIIPLAKNIGGINIKGTMKDLRGVYNLDELNFDYNSPKPDGNKANQFIRFSYDGLTATRENMLYADLVPEKSEVDLELKNIPLDSILNILKTQVEKTDKPSAAQQLIMMQMITTLPSKLAKAGTLFDINHIDFKNDTYDFETNGKIKASAASPFGMVGQINLGMKGLEKTQALISEKMTDAPAKDKAILERLNSQLTSLKSIMKKKIGGYESEIELDESGSITINGEDMGNPISAVGKLR